MWIIILRAVGTQVGIGVENKVRCVVGFKVFVAEEECLVKR